MRVLLAVHGFPPTHAAGAERRAERMARWLTEHGHHVEVFAIERVDAPSFAVDFTPPSEHCLYPVHRVSLNLADDGQPFRNSYDHCRLQAAIREMLDGERFDLVHVVSGYLLAVQTITAARERQIPVAVTLTEFWFLCHRLNLMQPDGRRCSGPEYTYKCVRCLSEEKRRYRLPARISPAIGNMVWRVAPLLPSVKRRATELDERQKTLRSALNQADLVISPSVQLIRQFAHYAFDTSRYRFIRQGLAHLPSRSVRVAARGPVPVLRVGYAGQIKFHKGVDLLIEAVAGLIEAGRTVTLDVWGSKKDAPDYVAQLERRVNHLPAIRWMGQYSGDAWTALESVDVIVVPSRWIENSPTIVLEAFAAGRPVIATNLGGMAELVSDGENGLLFEVDDAGHLQRQLERLVDQPEFLARLQSGIPRVKTIGEEMAEIVAEYEGLLRPRGAEGTDATAPPGR